MASHMKLPLPTRNNFPRSTDTTPRSLKSPGGQSPCEAYFNGGMGLSPMSAYFEGPQFCFGGNAGPAGPGAGETPNMMEQAQQAPTSPVAADPWFHRLEGVCFTRFQQDAKQGADTQPDADGSATGQQTLGLGPPLELKRWDERGMNAAYHALRHVPDGSRPTLLQGAAASMQKAVAWGRSARSFSQRAHGSALRPKPTVQSTGRRPEARQRSPRLRCSRRLPLQSVPLPRRTEQVSFQSDLPCGGLRGPILLASEVSGGGAGEPLSEPKSLWLKLLPRLRHMDLLRIQLISGGELTLSAAEISDCVETPGLLSVKALKQYCSSQVKLSIFRQRLVYKNQDKSSDPADVPLTAAARAGKLRVVELLLEAGDHLDKARWAPDH
eukprot:Skav217665  [mRNA]  locus=scaffold2919:159304:163886:+ [translate_table: standard]